jgi:sporulation protein YlmC with PRC-barrel domain
MNAAKMKLAVCSMALLCVVAAVSLRAADPAESPRESGASQTQVGMKTVEGVPGKFNKASNFIGMDVRNENDEHLGHIKDVVFDLKSGRVSYVVMTTAPKDLPELNAKLLAVPLKAFTVSPDEKYLVLNADKTRLDTTLGFDEQNWPSMANPNWGTEHFWNDGTVSPSTTRTPVQSGAMPNK